MIEVLKKVRGAVSSKDLVPVLTHFLIQDGRLQGSNGRITLDAPCPDLSDLAAAVPAERFLRAIDACNGEPKLTLGEGCVIVQRSRFRAKLPTLAADSYPREEIGVYAHSRKVAAPLLPTLRSLAPFISDDASRPWSCSVMLTATHAYATNNVVLVRVPSSFWSGSDAPLILPAHAVDELLRIGEEPEELRLSANSVTFVYGDWWMKSRLNEGAWPDLTSLVAQMSPKGMVSIPADLRASVAVLKPFFPDAKLPVVLLGPDGCATQDGQHNAAVGVEGLPPSAFREESLMAVLERGTHWDLSKYPAPVPFAGPGIEGLLSGVRL